jgi:hypothetical protein
LIGYLISRPGLEALITQYSPQWLNRAGVHTATFAVQGAYIKHTAIWSEIKAVYIGLQGHSKCAYCERKFESVQLGKIELAIEHFRPKSKVKRWRLPVALRNAGIALANVPLPNGGYYLLTYDVHNYCAACGPCNTILKRNYFPIVGAYGFAATTSAALAAEQALLLYPITDDAEQFIEFYGVSPRPTMQHGHGRSRALVTIDFFKLDDFNTRKNLVRERALLLTALFPQLEAMCGAGSPQDKQIASGLVFSYLASTSPHSNCMRSFVLLFFTAPNEARVIYEFAAGFVSASS